MKGLFKYMSFKRLKNIFFIWLSNTLPLRGHHRYKILRLAGINIKGKCFIYKNVNFDTVSPELITIGKNVTLTHGCTILTHYFDPRQAGRNFRYGKVIIEDDVFIGINAIICNSVTIGNGAIIGAGSVVTKDIPPFQVWAGNPARYIKDREH